MAEYTNTTPKDGEDWLALGRKTFEKAVEAFRHNHDTATDDIEFALLEKQWPDTIAEERRTSGRPMLTINKLKTFIRQVVNDARQNKPSIKVHPVDDNGDPETAEIMSGLIRNIEYSSNADTAYDTATSCAVSNGFGYFAIDIDYAHDDTFDLDITIRRIANPFSVIPDPYSTAADSSDWNDAFELDTMTRDEFEREYGPDKGKIDWDQYFNGIDADALDLYCDEKNVVVAKWWHREEVKRTLLLLTNPNGEKRIVDAERYSDPEIKQSFDIEGWQKAGEREVRSYKVVRRIMTGGEVLKEEEWPGIYIPIVPVYGDEVDVKGKRYFYSLIHSAIDAQRMFNYWRTNATELVALAPRVPFIGPKGAFKTDPNWSVANTANLPFLEYDGQVPPQRQPLDTGAAAGSLQEALNASDDIKATIGMYDASLGARSNETSGRAIMARQREGDVATFHFLDNMARAIRHAGRILLDLIPKVYDAERVIRTIGEDGTPETVPLGQPVPVMDEETGEPQMQQVPGPMGGPPVMEPVTRIFDLTAGKYDLTVSTGPSFTSRREEAATMMTEFVRAYPGAAPAVMPIVAKAMDWPMADEIAKRLEQGGMPPEAQKAMEQTGKQLQQAQQQVQQLTARVQELEMDKTIDAKELEIKEIDAGTKRMEAVTHRMDVLTPDPVPMYDAQTRRYAATKPEPPKEPTR